ncbi:secretin [Marinobacter changyiensis]|uniref:secretin n=1 Tax=Marinobacter changyiensis TaxID=2604091 RepID=UPI001264EC20|nr:secretin [Marinobacter changyiensis]
MKLQLISVLFVVLSGFAASLSAAPEARTHALNNRPAQEIATQLRELYPGNQLAISTSGQQLIIRGEPQLLDEVGMLVNTMDVAPVQMRITVRSGNADDRYRQGGGVTISDNNVNIGAEQTVTTTRRNREQNIVVQDGQSAHISSGQVRALPMAIRGGRNPAAIFQQVDIRSGFIIMPQVISDRQIELKVMAFDDDPKNDLPGYETEAVMTIRRVEPGQWVKLGSTETSSAGSRSGILYDVGGSRVQSQSFEVRVDIM